MHLVEGFLILFQRLVALIALINAGAFLFALARLIFGKGKSAHSPGSWAPVIIPDELAYMLLTLAIGFPLAAVNGLLWARDPESRSARTATYISLIMASGLIVLLLIGLVFTIR